MMKPPWIYVFDPVEGFFLAVTMLLNFNKNKKNLQHDKKAERVKKKKMTDTWKNNVKIRRINMFRWRGLRGSSRI